MHRKKPFHYRSRGNAVKESIFLAEWKSGMMISRSYLKTIMIAVVLAGCATVEENPKKNAHLGLITTPPTYYTTQRARYLGEKYKTTSIAWSNALFAIRKLQTSSLPTISRL